MKVKYGDFLQVFLESKSPPSGKEGGYTKCKMKKLFGRSKQNIVLDIFYRVPGVYQNVLKTENSDKKLQTTSSSETIFQR